MRDQGLQEAIESAGGVRALARALGISQPAVSMWKRIPLERVAEVETATGVRREKLRPDIFGAMNSLTIDPVDAARAENYDLLATLLWRAPSQEILTALAALKGSPSELGMAHLALAAAAAEAKADAVQREFFALFIGVGRGELLPYASYYLTGFLHERPLAKLRGDMRTLGIERDSRVSEPEDHIAVLCEIMSFVIRSAAERDSPQTISDQAFFERHLKSWAARFFADLETAKEAQFYRAVGAVGRTFMEIEEQAFALPN